MDTRRCAPKAHRKDSSAQDQKATQSPTSPAQAQSTTQSVGTDRPTWFCSDCKVVDAITLYRPVCSLCNEFMQRIA